MRQWSTMAQRDGCGLGTTSAGSLAWEDSWSPSTFPIPIPASTYGLGDIAFDDAADLLVVHGNVRELKSVSRMTGAVTVLASNVWNGWYCAGLGSGCSCAGEDCDEPYGTMEDCVAERRPCCSQTCEPQVVADDPYVGDAAA